MITDGRRDGRLRLAHANEGEMQRMQTVYHCDDRRTSTSGNGTPFHLGFNTRKGHAGDTNIHKAHTCKHELPSGIICHLIQVCLHVQVSPHLSYKLCKHTFTHSSTRWHPQTWLSSTVARKVSNWKRAGCLAAQFPTPLHSSVPSNHLN